MQKLISELKRLYLLDGQLCWELNAQGELSPQARPLNLPVFDQHLRGETTVALKLAGDDKLGRTMVIDFDTQEAGGGEQQWQSLCDYANALQTRFGLPAPGVCINGVNGYQLWLSLQTAVPSAQARRFVHLLDKTLRPGYPARNEQSQAVLPPALRRSSGRWAAFINPGMGSSFADEPGLEMTPPWGAQAAFLESLDSISPKQFAQAFSQLDQDPAPAPQAQGAPDGLLLKDATLEDIVKFLHGKNIEPTFRHLLARD
jgi:hypothetical protein